MDARINVADCAGASLGVTELDHGQVGRRSPQYNRLFRLINGRSLRTRPLLPKVNRFLNGMEGTH